MDSAQKNVLVTGANSGLGLGICLRLIDDFIHQSESSQRLNIIFTTRSKRKADETLRTLQTHLSARHHAANQNRVTFQPETNVDLTNLPSIRDLARRLNASDTLEQLDALICNAGIGGWSGMNWPLTIYGVLTDIAQATTWPPGKLGIVGATTQPQLPLDTLSSPEPVMGEVFTANVFGHYMLQHWLMPLLRACSQDEPGKVVWISSIEPGYDDFQEDDIQGLKTNRAYEHSKRTTDLLALTSNQAAAAQVVKKFTSTTSYLTKSKRPDNGPPQIHVTHPGVVATNVIIPPFPLNHLYPLGIGLARLWGGVWSTVTTHAAAHSTVWLTLASDKDIRKAEKDVHSAGEGRVKWGTRAHRTGATEVRPSEVEYWGINGSGQPFTDTWWGGQRGRKRGSKDATKEQVDEFIAQGVRTWQTLEKLREDWEARLEEHDRLEQ